jgi:hypothetical protein
LHQQDLQGLHQKNVIAAIAAKLSVNANKTFKL